MFRATLHHQPFKISILEKAKAGMLCLLMIFASAPNLHAQTQCSTPYETNCVVTVGPNNCGNLGLFPCWIKYDVTLADDTPGAQIHYVVFEGPYEIDFGWVATGQHVVETINYDPLRFGSAGFGEMNGYMYATASGYTQSNQASISF
ncbi:MAG: hypothetical protein WB679_03045 [Terracidiphilus sp.]|jgi:hypothetical protein